MSDAHPTSTADELLPQDKLQRLRTSIRNARQRMRPFREKRMEVIKQFVGAQYSENGASDRVPVNLLDLALTIYQQNLSAKAPKVLCTTEHLDLKPQALLLEMAINHLLPKIRFSETIRRAVMDALFSWGVVKIGIDGGHDSTDLQGFTHDAGQPFVDVVDLDDWFFDIDAKRWDQISFCGNRYRVPLESAQKSDLYDADVRAKLQQSHIYETDDQGERRAESVSAGRGGERATFEKMVELQDIWLPRDGVVVTLAAEMDLPPLRVVKWKGPQGGPYLTLGYAEVPGNIYPKSPAMNWMDIHDLANVVFRKLGRQAERAKTIAGVLDGGEKDGERTIKANDGDMVKMDNPDRVREFKFGGADPQNLAFLMQLDQMFSRMAGNLDTLGGLSPQAGTLGQEELLSQGSSKKIQDMQTRTIEFTRAIIYQIAFYLWNDPLIKLPLTYQHPAGVTIPMEFSAENRKGDFWQYDIQIDPYSMSDQSPGSKLQGLMNVVSGIIMPLGQQIQQQGGQVDFQVLMETIAKYGNMAELNQILKFQTPPQTPQPPQISAPPNKAAAPTTQHTSVRVNRGGSTARGKANVLISSLMGAGQQPKELEMAGRPVG